MVSPNEDQKETMTIVKDVFKHLGLSSKMRFSAKRITNTKKDAQRGRNGRKGWPPIVHVAFGSEDTKSELFPRLKNLKGTNNVKLTLTIDNLSMIRWWVDAPDRTYCDYKGHTGLMMSLGGAHLLVAQ